MKLFSFAATLAAVAAMSAPAPVRAATALTDPQIVQVFATANSVEVLNATLALAKSKNDGVRDFANLMISDHQALNNTLQLLVQRLKITPQPNPASAALEQGRIRTTEQLNPLDGKAFDQAYIAHEISYHQQLILVIQRQLLPAVHDGELKGLLQSSVNLFQQHLEDASGVSRALGP